MIEKRLGGWYVESKFVEVWWVWWLWNWCFYGMSYCGDKIGMRFWDSILKDIFCVDYCSSIWGDVG